MADDKHWQVIITNQIKPDQDRQQIIDQLALLFKTDASRMATVFNKAQTVIKDNVDEATARKYFDAVSRTGADCQIINKADETLPSIIEPVKPPDPGSDEGLVKRPTAQTSPAGDPTMALVEKQAQQEKDTREKLSPYEKVSADLYCPACGTIRSSATAVCLHCNYDPASVRKSQAKSKLLSVLLIACILIVVLGAAGYLARPYYQQYMLKSKIADGLQLAFETRNHITRFILDTHFWPNQNIDANLPRQLSNDVIASIEIVENGTFVVKLREELLNRGPQTMIFKPAMSKGRLVWNCYGGSLENEYRPELCRAAP